MKQQLLIPLAAVSLLALTACNFEFSGSVEETDSDDDIGTSVNFHVQSISPPASRSDLLFDINNDARFQENKLTDFSSRDFSGETIRLAGPYLGTEKNQLVEVLKYFAYATNATIVYEGTSQLEVAAQDLAGTELAQDLMIFPQPGLMRDLAGQDKLFSLSSSLDRYVRNYYSAGDSWADFATFPDSSGSESLYGLFYRVDLKSIVWYDPNVFDDNGWAVPTTQEALLALTEDIAENSNIKPWAIGLSSGQASGWPGTDWVEDYLLRTSPLDVYNGWITNEVKFDDDRIIDAIELFGNIALNSNFVAGNPENIDFRDVGDYLFSDPPQAAMTKQASFVTAFFPPELEVGVDYDFFYFPAFNGRQGDGAPDSPVMGGGVAIGLTQNSNAARSLIDFFATPLAHELWMAQGNFLSPNGNVNATAYKNDSLRNQGDIIRNADAFAFDGSDMMPAYIGADAFWQGMMDYVRGGQDVTAQSIAQEIQQAWDTGP